MIKRPCVSLCALLAVSGSAFASSPEEDSLTRAFGDEDFISIATGYRQPISLAPAVASVITADDIKRIGARDLDEVLETVPGLHVSVAPRGYLPLYTVRGIYSENNPQVLFLINDIPITNLYVGNRGELWGGMPVQDIERIEIIRGPGSAIYGADAFAGTINIITKGPGDIHGTEAGIRAGSFDTREGWILQGGHWLGFDLSLSMQLMTTDGHRRTIETDAQSILDAAFGTSASHAPGPVDLDRSNKDIRLEAARGNWRMRLGYQGRSGGVGAGVALALDPSGEGESERLNADITYDAAITQHWDINATLSYLGVSAETDLTLFPAGAFGGAFPDGMIARPYIYERHIRGNVSALFHGFDNHSLRFGAGAIRGEMYKIRESKNYAPDSSPLAEGLVDVSDDANLVFMRPQDRNVQYLFVQDEWALSPNWRLTSGLRHDHYSDFGDTTNPRFALVWRPRHDVTTKVLYGRAFRAPAFNELYNINNPVAEGYQNLKPETIDTYELAVNYQPSSRIQAGINLFNYRMRDVIRFMPQEASPQFRASNTGEIEGYGLELEASYSPTSAVRILGNYAYQNSEDDLLDTRVANAPRHQVYLRANWNVHPSWSVTAQSTWIADRKRDTGDPRSDIDDYTIVDMTLRYRSDYGTGPWELAASVRNAFDEDAREPSPRLFPDGTPMIPNDLPLSGRHFFVEARYHIGGH